MNTAILSKLIKSSFTTFNKPSMLQGLRSYKKSPAQAHLHDYICNQVQLQKLKSQKIDYQFITKQSAGSMMFREFVFQQKTQQTLVPHLNCYLLPTGAWTFDQIKKELGHIQNLTKTQQQNKQILQQCEPDVVKSIQQYYTNIGKKNYQFNLEEEINKINQMTEEQFREWAKIVHGKEIEVKQIQNQSQTQTQIQSQTQYQQKKRERSFSTKPLGKNI